MSPAPKTRIVSTYLSRKPKHRPLWTVTTAGLLLVALSLLAWPEFMGLDSWLSATGDEVFRKHQYWRLFTALGVHGDLKHLLANGFYFAGLGYLLAAYFGPWAFPVLSILGGSLTHAFALATYPPEVRLLGASGVVYLMMAFWLALYFGIERRLSIPRRLVNCVGFSLALLVPEAAEQGTSYRTHGIGFAIGLLLGALFFMNSRRKFRRAEVRKAIEEYPLEDPPAAAPGTPEDDSWDEGLP